MVFEMTVNDGITFSVGLRKVDPADQSILVSIHGIENITDLQVLKRVGLGVQVSFCNPGVELISLYPVSVIRLDRVSFGGGSWFVQLKLISLTEATEQLALLQAAWDRYLETPERKEVRKMGSEDPRETAPVVPAEESVASGGEADSPKRRPPTPPPRDETEITPPPLPSVKVGISSPTEPPPPESEWVAPPEFSANDSVDPPTETVRREELMAAVHRPSPTDVILGGDDASRQSVVLAECWIPEVRAGSQSPVSVASSLRRTRLKRRVEKRRFQMNKSFQFQDWFALLAGVCLVVGICLVGWFVMSLPVDKRAKTPAEPAPVAVPTPPAVEKKKEASPPAPDLVPAPAVVKKSEPKREAKASQKGGRRAAKARPRKTASVDCAEADGRILRMACCKGLPENQVEACLEKVKGE